MDSALAHRIPRIIFTSSTSVYGDAQGTVKETTPRNPVTNSGRVLEELEDWLHNLPGTSVDILRLAGLVGPGRHPGRFFAGKTAPDGEHGVNLVHLEDVIGAITLLLQAPKGGHIYNICAPAHPARNVFYPQMARLLGLEPPQFRNSLDSGKGKIIDGSRICNELGFEIPVSRSAGNAAGVNDHASRTPHALQGGVYETTAGCVDDPRCLRKRRQFCGGVGQTL